MQILSWKESLKNQENEEKISVFGNVAQTTTL
jgi:hypothetical protein